MGGSTITQPRDDNKNKSESTEDKFRLHVLGVGNFFSEHHSTTAFVLQAGDRLVGIEAPAEYRKKLFDYRAAVQRKFQQLDMAVSGIDRVVIENIDDFVITHHHGDHCNGLEDIGYFKMYKQNNGIFVKCGENSKGFDFNQRPTLYGTKPVLKKLHKKVEVTMCDGTVHAPEYYFNQVELKGFIPETLEGGLSIRAASTDHGVPGFAPILSFGGRSVSYSSDTRFNQKLADFLGQADVMIHECDGTNSVHTAPEELLRWRDSAKYDGKLYVVHVDDKVDLSKHGLRSLPAGDFIDI